MAGALVTRLPFLAAAAFLAAALTDGTALLGSRWLGGPIGFSLLLHAIACVGCAFALRSVMCALVRTFASLIGAIRFVWLAIARARGDSVCFNVRRAPFLRAQAPHVRQIGGRAPPLLRIAYARM